MKELFMKILVTGATGFLGLFLCAQLRKLGHDIYEANSKNCDLTKEGSLEQFNAVRFDQIYHLATWMQAGDFCLHHGGELWIINQKIHTNMLSWWQEKQPRAKMITIGTSCAYDPNLPLEEKYYLEGQPIESLHAYGMSKKMLLAGLMALNKQYGLDYLYLIPSTLFGAGYHLDGKQLHFIFDLVRKILQGHMHGDPVVLWGDGNQKRELVHIGDFVKTMLDLVATQKNTTFNIGAGEEHTIASFAQKICTIVGFPYEKIQYDTSRYVGAKSKVLLIKKLLAVYPQYKLRSLDEGLSEIVAWFYSYLQQTAAMR